MMVTETTGRYDAQVELHKEFGESMIATIFDELCNVAHTVKKAQGDMDHIVKDNAERIANGQDPFYKRSTVDNAADFERAYAQYEVVERLFVSACYFAKIERDMMVALITVARKGR